MRLMVTGCREWPEREHVWGGIENHYDPDEPFVLIVGDCPTGVDAYAREWGELLDVEVCVFRADWRRLGRAAGPERNRAMVQLGKPQRCLAFWDGKSHGTRNAIAEAVSAGLHVDIVPLPRAPLRGWELD